MNVSTNLKNKNGFTLMELLIGISIAGVLAIVAVPSYQRMVAKAKTMEAKSLLAGLYASETMFYSEYGAYGNKLSTVGFVTKEKPSFYNVGFFWSGDCRAVGSGGARPKSDQQTGIDLVAVEEDYYTQWDTFIDLPNDDFTYSSAIIGNGALKNCAGNGGLPEDGSAFTASAQGVIAHGVGSNPTDANDVDRWAINESRELVHTRDGIK